MGFLKQQGLNLLLNVWQAGRFDELPTILHDDVVRHDERLPARGIVEYRRIVELYRTAFPDLTYSIICAVEEAAEVGILYEVSGTHLGPFLQIAPTGAHGALISADFYRFKDGRMTDIYPVFSERDLLCKLGLS